MLAPLVVVRGVDDVRARRRPERSPSDPPICSFKGRSTVWPRLESNARCSTVLNPCSSALTVYLPGVRNGTSNRPSASDDDGLRALNAGDGHCHARNCKPLSVDDLSRHRSGRLLPEHRDGASQEYRDDHCHLSHLHCSSSESMLGNVNFANQDDVPPVMPSRHFSL